jgi:hypothetical protein
MRFTRPEIEALVETARFTDKPAAAYLAQILEERQQKIGKVYFSKVLPLDDARVENGKLMFEDLAVKYGFSPPREYRVRWAVYDNETQSRTDLNGVAGQDVPRSESEFLLAEISSGDPKKRVLTYLRRTNASYSVVGVDRTY